MQEKVFASGTDAHISRKYFEIKGAHYKEKCFPSLNDLLREAERHPMAYNKMKKDYEFIATNAIRRYLRGWKSEGRVILHIQWGEPKKGKIRDYDNIVSAGRKIINDALVKTKTIVDDNPKYLGYGTNEFVYVDTPFIRVEIEEVE